MARIYVCGETLIDFVPGHDPSGQMVYTPKCGGSPFNAAKVAARTGGDVWFLGAISNDFFGDQLSQDLIGHGVACDLAPRTDDPTTLAFVDMSTGSPRYAFYNNSTATQNIQIPPGTVQPKSGDILDVGSVSLIDKPGADNIADLCAELAGQIMISVDPNVRPSMIDDPEEWNARMDRILKQASIIKVSDEDLDFMAPEETPKQFAERMLKDQAELVVVTYGEKGVEAYTGQHFIQVAAPQITVADTVGAGDALMGALLSSVSALCGDAPDTITKITDTQLRKTLEFSAAAAALNCTKVGAYPPTSEEIAAFLSSH